jgi:tRNA nucleotidyltransferase (CCA-adding enzyme)
LENVPYAPASRLPPLLQAALAIDSAAVAAAAAERGARGPAIGDAVRAARVQAISQQLQKVEPAAQT